MVVTWNDNAGNFNWGRYIGWSNNEPTISASQHIIASQQRSDRCQSLDKLIGKSFQNTTDLSPISRPKLHGEIEFKNVTYKFEGSTQPTINNISFKIPAGQKVALVGKMGSGKSTLSRLIAGILEPTEGAIQIDGVDVRQIEQADVRKNIGLMLQDSWLFLEL